MGRLEAAPTCVLKATHTLRARLLLSGGRSQRTRVATLGHDEPPLVPVMAHTSTPGPKLWRTLNILQRIAGFSAMAAGILFGAWAIWHLANPGQPVPADLPQDPRLARGAVLAFAAVLLALGAVLLRARPYRPDLGDSLASGHDLRLSRPADSPRRWWTGDSID